MAGRSLGAEISRALAARGVEVIFGIPGVHNVELYRGIEEAGITHVLARHEQGAGFMADGYARATGRVGVCYGISGPGLTNLLTPLGQAYSDSVAVLAVTSCLDEVAHQRGQLHQMRDQAGAARAVCDWSETARGPGAAYGLIARAFGEFAAARPRPKHITVPIQALGAKAPRAPSGGAAPARPTPAAQAVTDAAALLQSAKRPLLIVGGGARGARAEIAALLARVRCVSVTTYQGRGLISPGDPLHLGAALGQGAAKGLLEAADVILAVGTELGAVDLQRAHLGHRGQMVRIDLDPEVLADLHGAQVKVLGDAAQALKSLLQQELGAVERAWSAPQAHKIRAQIRASTDALYPGLPGLAEAIQAALPEGTMVFSDMTQLAYAAKDVLPAAAPGLWHHPCGFGTLGYALPAAIGGKVGVGAAPVVAIAGDYGFQYTLQELGAAVELGLPLPILLWDNGKLKEIEDAMIRAQIPPHAVTAQNPDFVRLAQAYGADATRPQSLKAMQEAIATALKAPGPTLIHLTPALLG